MNVHLRIRKCKAGESFDQASCTADSVSRFLTFACASRNPDQIREVIREILDSGSKFFSTTERTMDEENEASFRDLYDCLVRALCHCCYDQMSDAQKEQLEQDEFNISDIFNFDLNAADPIAILQTLCVEVEKTLGIYPDVPKLIAETEAE